ncbi:hypothetical protein [Puniceibacterium sp. IMCC21224]|uniref:hypothetical protein n=1 Tax=Puniceibacterium sp. IMCC21224 TaxID=1618204 RepID=UPI00064DBE3D|nr:hypothetical protein [Puniceibacterium sp. IMCC21224]KMK66350.1 hypothetical protein IMCC21224_111200 [Puniceibacterium sp. IMCC21224]
MKLMTALHLLALCAALPGAATAQSTSNCAPRDVVIARLGEKFGETRQSVGLGSNNAVVEVFASNDSGSWTIVVTATDGQSCLIASGQAFEALAEALPIPGNDA